VVDVLGVYEVSIMRFGCSATIGVYGTYSKKTTDDARERYWCNFIRIIDLISKFEMQCLC